MALQDFGSLSLTNTPTGAQGKAAGPRAGKTTPLDAAVVDRIIAEEGADGVKPVVLGIYGQESSGGTDAHTSVDNAHGGMQIIPDTFNRFAKPGERIDNPEDNFRVGVRILKTLGDKFGNDTGRIATGYFSGEGNVNARGDTPYKQDRRDSNGKLVSSYVRDLVGRVGNTAVPDAKAAEPAPDISKAPKYRDFIGKPQWGGLDDAQKDQARNAYFDRYVAPHLAPAERDGQRAAFLDRAAQIEGTGTARAAKPGVFDRIKGGVAEVGGAILGAMGSGTDSADGAAIDPTALAAPAAADASKIGVAGTKPMPVAPGASRAPVTPEFRTQVERAWDAADPAQRQLMQGQDGVVGQLARERATRFGMAPDTKTGNLLDPRREARAARMTAEGADAKIADKWAQYGAGTGQVPGTELGTAAPSDFNFDAQKLYNREQYNPETEKMEGGALSHGAIRGLVQANQGFRKASLGLAQAYFDAVGNPELADIAAGGIKDANKLTAAMGEKGDILNRNFEGAVSSIAQQLPALTAGAVTGSEAIPLAAMFTQTFGQEYGDGRAQGLDGQQSASRAAIFGVFEVLGEKFGLGHAMQAMKLATKGAATKDIAGHMAHSILADIPGEQFTTLGEFLTDKIPGIGTNLEAGLADYAKQAADTLIQTMMQGGMMMGGTTGVGAGVRHMQGVVPQNPQELAADQAREQALNKSAAFFQPPVRPKHASTAAAEQVVREMAAEAGMDPAELLPAEKPAPVAPVAVAQPAPTAPAPQDQPSAAPVEQGAAPAGQPAYDPREVMDFAQTRYERLLAKRDGEATVQTGEDGRPVDGEVAGQALTPDEQRELAVLEQSSGDVGALARFYGFDEGTANGSPSAVPPKSVDSRGAAPDAGMATDPAAGRAGPVPGSDGRQAGAEAAAIPHADAVPGADGAANGQPALSRQPSGEPPIAAGMTRLYHGGEAGRYDGPAWFSTSRKYAEGYATKDGRTGTEVQYVDYPTEKVNALADPDGYGQTPAKGFDHQLELSSEETGPRKPLPAAEPARAAAPVAAAPAEMSDEQLRARLDYMREQARANGGWNKLGADERNRIEAELARRAAAASPPAADAAQALDAAAHEAATSPANSLPEPTDAQKQAGNYKMGHASLHGLDITIENPRGSTRSGTDADGKAWSVEMANHYGYIKRTEGADGDHVDVFIGPKPESTKIFVVDQIDPRTGKYDEHKVLMGFSSLAAARAGYLANYEQGWKGAGAITPMSMDEFKAWLKEGDTTKPLNPKVGKPKTEKQAKAAREQAKPAAEAPAAEPASPVTKTRTKPKTEKELAAERKAVIAQKIGGNEGDVVIPSKDVGYLAGGRPVKIERIDKDGEVHFVDLENGGRTSLSAWTLGAALRRGLKFSQQDSAAPAAADQMAVKQEGQAQPEKPAETPPAEQKAEPELERDRNGNVERQPKLEGEDRYQPPAPMGTSQQAKDVAAAQAKVVDYMNGELSRTALMTALEQSGLPQGTIYSITQRLGDDGPSIGEVDAMLARREKGQPAPGARAKPKTEKQLREDRAQRLDHGELNIPGRTNSIDAELDRYKAQQAAEAKARRKADAVTNKADKARAKELFAQHGEALIAKHSTKLGVAELRKTLDSMVKWEPAKFIALVEKFQQEQAEAPAAAAIRTNTEAFRRWFGKSKVAEGGKPLVMYHGTSGSQQGEAFTSFDTYASNYGLMGMGGYFTADPAVASSYTTKGKGSTPTVYPVYLSIKNPIDMDAKAAPGAWKKQFDGIEQYHEGGVTNESWYRAAEESLSDQEIPKWEGAEIMQDGLRAMGYDGITHVGGGRVASDGVRHRVFIAFDPEQIKSAIGNRGTFDPAAAEMVMKRSPPRGAVSAEDLRAQFAPIQKQWQNGPKGGVEVVQSVDDLPPHLAEALRSAGEDGRVEGFYLPKSDKVYLIADNLPSAERAQEVAFHEVYGHKGLRAILPAEQYAAMMDRIRRANPKIAAAADDWFDAYGGDTIRMNRAAGQAPAEARRNAELLAVEEALADMAATVPVAGPVRKLLAALQAGLRKIGLHGAADWLEGKTEAETFKLLRDARAAVFGKTGKGETHVSQAPANDSAPAFSRSRDGAQMNLFRLFQKDEGSVDTMGKWDRTVGTQYNKALKDQHFGKVFGYALAMQNEVSMASIRPAELAPGLLHKVDGFKPALRALVLGRKRDKELEGATMAIFSGSTAGATVAQGQVWKDEDLRSKFGLTDRGIRLYKQARSAINASLDEVAAAEAYAMSQGFVPKGLRRTVMDDPAGARGVLMGSLDQQIRMLERATKAAARGKSEAEQASTLETVLEPYIATRDRLEEIFERAASLKLAGYAPLLRFGKYTVYANEVGPNGEVLRDENDDAKSLYFGVFETEAEAIRKADELRAKYADQGNVRVSRGKKDQKGHELFSGISPETVALFGDVVGQDEATKQFYQKALSERSALKRRLGRRAIDGYSTDLPRVLSNFITSNGRFAAQRYYLRDLNNAIRTIPKTKGDVKDEAIELRNYLMDANDAGSGASSLMFAYFLGGSVASAAVNLTQPFMMTAPYLSQWGAARTAAAMTKAMPYALGKKQIADPDLRAALRRGSQEGIVEAQEIFHLYSQGAQTVSASIANRLAKIPKVGKSLQSSTESARARLEGFFTLWGSMFAAAESFNRKLTFVAAWDVAKATKQPDPYEFAVRAVNETQGIFNKVNRPNWARSTTGRLLMTFKQYSIMYLELTRRMWRAGPAGKRAVLMMMAVLFLAAGEEGLPFAQDINDLVDTIGQSLGYDTNLLRDKRKWAHKILGQTGGDFALYGLSSMLPLDFSGRLGMGNLIPGTGLLKPAESADRTREVTDVVGPAGALVSAGMDAYDAFSAKQPGRAVMALMPKAINNAFAGVEMAMTDKAVDYKGRKVTDVGLGDAIIKGVGFTPTKVAEDTRRRMPARQDISLVKKVQADIVDLWTRGLAEGDKDMQERAAAWFRDWNEKNPDSPIQITNKQLIGKVKQMATPSADRMLKAAPKGLRGRLAGQLAAAEEE